MRQILRRTGSAVRFTAALALIALSGCLDVDSPRGLTILQIISGKDQTLPTGGVAAPMIVRAYDERSSPMPGVVVTWAVAQGTGTLSAVSSTTDANGDASTIFTAGTTTGTVYITATADPLQLVFSAQIVPAS